MPIRSENRALYPKNWPDIRLQVLERACFCCERCSVPDRAYGYRDAKGNFHELTGEEAVNPPSGVRAFMVILTIAHLNHDPRNNDLGNLEALCCQCHNRLDAPVRAANRKQRLRKQYNLVQVSLDFRQESGP